MFELALNAADLPYPDPIHPIVVHFVIAMVVFSFCLDAIGYLTRNPRLFEVSFWNLLVAAIAIFAAIIFGQLEAGLAHPYDAVRATLNLHTLTGWSLAAILVMVTAWRLVIRRKTPLRLPAAYLSLTALLTCLVLFQTYLGTKLVWVYGLHIEPVVQAMK